VPEAKALREISFHIFSCPGGTGTKRILHLLKIPEAKEKGDDIITY
jgi:hypothetical protein